jgi:hypothetical protein
MHTTRPPLLAGALAACLVLFACGSPDQGGGASPTVPYGGDEPEVDWRVDLTRKLYTEATTPVRLKVIFMDSSGKELVQSPLEPPDWTQVPAGAVLCYIRRADWRESRDEGQANVPTAAGAAAGDGQ